MSFLPLYKKKTTLIVSTLTIGIAVGISIGILKTQAAAIRGIETYTPTTTGATEVTDSLSCGEQGWQGFTFYIENGAPEDTTYDGYFERIYKYRINLHEDFVDNVDMENLLCATPPDSDGIVNYVNCDGESDTNESLELETNVTLTNNYDGTYSITWSYDDLDTSNSISPNRPWMLTLDEDNNSYQTSVSFYAKDDVETGATATSDGEIYRTIWGLALDSDDDENDTDTWDSDDYILLPDNSSIGFDNTAWYTDGDTAVTTFEACAECADLDITSPTTIAAEDAGDTHNIVIDVDDQDGDPWDGEYIYSAYDSDGNLSDCEFSGNNATGWDNPLDNTNDENIYVKNCNAGDTIYVEEEDYPDACTDQISITDRCDDLTITSPTEITVEDLEESYVTITIATEGLSGELWDGNYTYTAYSSDGALADGEFHKSTSVWYLLSRDNPYSTTAETVYYFNGEPGDRIVVTEDDYPTYCSDEITAEEEVAPYCGDGVQDAGEECDDGNDDETDGCLSDCTTPEEVEVCDLDGVLEPENGEQCDDGNTVDTDTCSNSCVPSTPPTGVCDLDGIVEVENGEVCDDGNTVDTDDCSNSCIPNTTTGGGVCDLDGVIEPENGETCDDGNTVDTDDCSNSCIPNTTTGGQTECGNGVLEPPEVCDDGNDVDTDSCSNSCTTSTTTGGGSTECGNGVLEPPEECDDGNDVDTDACSNSCTTPGGGGEEENPYCGDGTVDTGEECDDANTDETDSCLSDCTIPEVVVVVTPPTAGDILKNVFTLEHEPLDVAWAEDEHLLYDVIYTAGTYDSVTITDTIAGGIDSNESSNGTITYDNELLVINCDTDAETCHNQIKAAALQAEYASNETTTDYLEAAFPGRIIPDCSSDPTILCYTGDPGSSITLNNLTENIVIAITYHAFMDSAVECKNPEPFGESFTNTASGDDGSQDDATLWALCTYLLTRNAGEVYFGKEPQFGHDISGYSNPHADKNTTGETFGEEDFTGTADSDIIPRIATFILEEMVRIFSENFSITTLADTVSENQIRISRYVTLSSTTTTLTSLAMTDLATLTEPKNNIYRFKGDVTINGNITVSDYGARTIIVEEGDLYINGDISYEEYEQNTSNPIPNPQDLPVIAFIVPDGDILIRPDVHEIDSVLYTTGGLYGNGKQTPWSPARLVITGAVFGDLEPCTQGSLLDPCPSSNVVSLMDPDARFAMGTPESDGGAVTIRYDERLLLNPPPGLQEYTDNTFTEVSR